MPPNAATKHVKPSPASEKQQYPTLRLITRLNIGGPARQALLLTRELSSEFPTVLAAGKPPTSEGELWDKQVNVRYVPLVREISPRADARALAAVRGLIRRQRPRLLHTHMAKAGAIGRIAARSARLRPVTVHTFHGHVLEGYFTPKREAAFVKAERWLARQTNALVAVSPQIRDQLYDLGIGRDTQWRVIPLGFELDDLLSVGQGRGILRRHLGVPETTPLVGMLGRLAPIKDHAMALRAWVHVENAHLVLLGDGDLRAELERLRDALGLRDRVHFTGWWHDVSDALSDLDVVVLTSRNEGTPVSLIEAQAASRPVVATDVGGVQTVVVEGSTGYLVNVSDALAVADRVNRLVRNKRLRAELGSAGREHVQGKFSHERLIADVSQLYRELIGS